MILFSFYLMQLLCVHHELHDKLRKKENKRNRKEKRTTTGKKEKKKKNEFFHHFIQEEILSFFSLQKVLVETKKKFHCSYDVASSAFPETR